MPDNPYDQPIGGPAVESASSRTVEILDQHDQTPIGGTSSVVSVDLRTGARAFTERSIRVRADDARLIDPAEMVYRCTCGCPLTTLTRVSVLFCGRCQLPVFLAHAKTWKDGNTSLSVCPACYEHGRLKRLLLRVCRWLTKH